MPYLNLYFRFWGDIAAATGYKTVNKLGRESAGAKKVHFTSLEERRWAEINDIHQ